MVLPNTLSTIRAHVRRFNQTRKRWLERWGVSRRRFQQLQTDYQALTQTLSALNPILACQAQLREIKPLPAKAWQELCFLVSYSCDGQLKPHVRFYAEHLQRQGIGVVLILNTDTALQTLQYEVGHLDHFAAMYARSNQGYDFAAWSQLFGVLKPTCQNLERLYLSNDSLAGPINEVAWLSLLQGIRSSAAGLVGLTDYAEPRWHAQSFFLVLSRALLNDAAFVAYFCGFWNLPSKRLAIDVYETWLTCHIQSLGYAVDVVFPAHTLNIKVDIYHQDDLLRYLSAGMPFIKFKNLQLPSLQAAALPYCSLSFCEALLPMHAKLLSKSDGQGGSKKSIHKF